MDFAPTPERRMLADSLDRLLADRLPFERRIAVAYEAPFHDPALWEALVELGALHALVPEEAGGFGGAGFDVATVFEALGRHICPEPVLPALMAARLLSRAGADPEPVLSGTHHAVVLEGVEGGPSLTGRGRVVYGGHVAERVLVCAGGALWSCDAPERTAFGMIDGGGAAEMFFEGTQAERVGEADPETARLWGALALCAEAVGVADRTLALTVDHLKTRKQFGRAIGSFQALQHRAVEMRMAVEQCRSIVMLAADRMDARTVSMAKHLIGKHGRRVAEEAIQMHGGMGMTWEAPVSHHAKRLVMIDAQLGDQDHHLRRVMAT